MLVSMVSLPVVRVSESPAIIPHGAVESWTLRGDHAGEPGVKPSVAAFVFLLFATRNPKPCPIVEVVDGGTEAARTAPGSDLPTYPDSGCSLMAGMWSRPLTLRVWRDGLVRVRLGGFSFEAALLRAGLLVRHIEAGCNAPMFVTDRQLRSGR